MVAIIQPLSPIETALLDEYMARYVYNLQTGKVFLSTTQKWRRLKRNDREVKAWGKYLQNTLQRQN